MDERSSVELFDSINQVRAIAFDSRNEPVTFMCPTCAFPIYRTSVREYKNREATHRTLAAQAQREHVCP